MREMLAVLTNVRSVCLSVTRLKSVATRAVYATDSVQPSPNAFGLVCFALIPLFFVVFTRVFILFTQ